MRIPSPAYPYLEVTLTYRRADGRETALSATGSSASPTPQAALAALRCDVITTSRLAVAEAAAGNMAAANASLRDLAARTGAKKQHKATSAARRQDSKQGRGGDCELRQAKQRTP